jgi:hypothetical protein
VSLGPELAAHAVTGHNPIGPGQDLVEVDSIELIPFTDITDADVRSAGNRTGRRWGTAPRTRAAPETGFLE